MRVPVKRRDRRRPAPAVGGHRSGVRARRAFGLAAAVAFVGLLCWAQLPAPDHAPPPRPVASAAASVPEPLPEDAGPLRFVGAAHVLVAYRGAERAPRTVQRTRDEAKARIGEVVALLHAEKLAFAEAVQRYSDDAATLPSNGDVGNFERPAMPPAFSEAAFALEIGQLSPIVETPLGFHVIRRTR
jgi:hypothetical protein